MSGGRSTVTDRELVDTVLAGKIVRGRIRYEDELPSTGERGDCFVVLGTDPMHTAEMYEWCPRREQWVMWKEWYDA